MFHNKLAKKFFLGIILAFPFLFLAWMGFIWDKQRQKNIESVAQKLNQQMAHQVETEINSYLNAPNDILDATQNALYFNNDFDLETLTFEEFTKIKFLFARPFENSADSKINASYIGTEKGYFLIQEKNEPTIINDKLFQNFNFSQKLKFKESDEWGVMDSGTSEKFDPTQRHWYQIAKEKKKPVWSKIYCDHSSETPAITATFPVYDKSDSDKLIAVLGIDFLLSEIYSILQEVIKGLESSSIFIVERESIGLVSDLQNTNAELDCDPKKEDVKLISAQKSEDLLVKEITENLKKKIFKKENIELSQDSEIDIAGERKFVRVISIQQENLDWLVVLVLSENAILKEGKFENRNHILFRLLVLMLSLLLVLSIFYRRERRFTIASRRFVPEEFLNLLSKDIFDLKLGDQVKQEMTIMFADVRSFTSLSERIKKPSKIFSFVNGYLGRVSPIIRENRGVVDKYLGDGIMALFPQSAEDALKAAISMQSKILEYNQHREKSNYLSIAIGIGLHTGSVILGTVGEPERIETTVISNAVNLAARLEGLTKLYGAKILISADTLFKLMRSEELQPLEYHHRF